MARPLRIHIPHAFYHVISRGNAKQTIFVGEADYERFLERLDATSSRFGVACRAYCLMPNHFHLLLQPDAHPVSRMMQQLNSAYCQSFNRHHERVGHVLQGRFKALLIDGDEYFLQLLRYIMLNPVKAGLVNDPGAWRWSSYRATAGLSEPPSFLAPEEVWRMFATTVCEAQRRFVTFVEAGRGQSAPSDTVVFGSDAFRADVAAALEPHRPIRDFSRRERYAVRPGLAAILADSQGSAARRKSMAEAYWRYGYTLREIADLIGCHVSTVFRQIRGAESVTTSETITTDGE
jgi:putative transposase